MFNREELLVIARDLKDEKLLEKINSMLYVDGKLVSILMDRYLPLDLIKIEKSNYENVYNLHFLESEKNEDFDFIWDNIKLANKYLEDNNLDFDLEIHTIEHKSMNEFWCYGGINVYCREDLALHINNKKQELKKGE